MYCLTIELQYIFLLTGQEVVITPQAVVSSVQQSQPAAQPQQVQAQQVQQQTLLPAAAVQGIASLPQTQLSGVSVAAPSVTTNQVSAVSQAQVQLAAAVAQVQAAQQQLQQQAAAPQFLVNVGTIMSVVINVQSFVSYCRYSIMFS